MQLGVPGSTLVEGLTLDARQFVAKLREIVRLPVDVAHTHEYSSGGTVIA